MNGDMVLLTAYAEDEITDQQIEDIRVLLRAYKFEKITIQRRRAKFVFEALWHWWQRLPP